MQHDRGHGRHFGTASFRRHLLRHTMALLVLGATSAQAQKVHTCIDGRGARSLQDQPCAPPQREVAVRTFKPVAVRVAADRDAPGRDSAPASRHARSRGDGGRARHATTACKAARQKRDATLERVGLKRTYDLLQRLDATVHAACARR